MAKQSPKCRIKVAYSTFRVGEIIQPGAMLRNDLLRRGWIEVMEEEQPVASVAVAELPSDEPPVKKRGRPRKDKGAT